MVDPGVGTTFDVARRTPAHCLNVGKGASIKRCRAPQDRQVAAARPICACAPGDAETHGTTVLVGQITDQSADRRGLSGWVDAGVSWA